MEIYEVLDEKLTVVYDNKKHKILVYTFIVPKRLLTDFNITKEGLLLYHSTPLFERKVRGGFNEKKLKSVIKEFKKLNKGSKNGK